MDLGINIWGSDLSENGEFLFPSESQIDYFAAKGFSNIRLTFGWETVQGKLDGPLNADFVSEVRTVVEYAASQGIDVVLDIHNYGKYDGQLIGSPSVPVSAFADLWSRIASEFVNDENVRFGLMNEPQQEQATDWLFMVNSAIAAIRDTGADQQILVPGIGWTGAWSWTGGDNAKIIGAPGAIVDPAGNYAFEVHQYLDDTSGQHEWVVSEDIGVERLTAITEWARENGVPLYLGEFGVADNPQALAALDKMMKYLTENADVWQSASYWVAGTANPTYIYTVEPDLKILDVPQMDVLEKYTGAVYTETRLADGTVRQDVYAKDGKVVTLSDVLSADGDLVSRSIFDADGDLRSRAVVSSDGGITVSVYGEAGKPYPATATVYNADHERVRQDITDEAGAVVVKLYEPGVHDPYQESAYHADGSLNFVTKHIDGQHIGETYTNGVLAKIEVYNAYWGLISRDSFDADGTLTQRQVDNSDGSHHISTFNATSGVIQSSTLYSATWSVTGTTSYDGRGHPTRQISYESDGGRTVVSYKPGTDTATRSEHLTSDGKLESLTIYSSDGQTTSIYAPPGSSRLQSTVVVEHGEVVSKTQYDVHGLISTIERIGADGGRSFETYDSDHQAHPVSVTAYDASWQLVNVTYFDSEGQVSVINAAGSKGINTLTSFVPGTDHVTQVEVYLDWKLQSRTQYDGDGKITSVQNDHRDGTYEVNTFTADHQDHPASTSLYDASWQLVSVTYFDDRGQRTEINVAGDNGLNTVTSFVPGTDDISKVEVYVDWKLQSRISYDEEGAITSIQTDHGDGTHEVQTFTPDHQDQPASTSLYNTEWKLIAFTPSEADHAEDVAIPSANSGSGKAIDLGFLVTDTETSALRLDTFAATSEAAPQPRGADEGEFTATHIAEGAFDMTDSDYDYAGIISDQSHIFDAHYSPLAVSPQYDLV